MILLYTRLVCLQLIQTPFQTGYNAFGVGNAIGVGIAFGIRGMPPLEVDSST